MSLGSASGAARYSSSSPWPRLQGSGRRRGPRLESRGDTREAPSYAHAKIPCQNAYRHCRNTVGVACPVTGDQVSSASLQPGFRQPESAKKGIPYRLPDRIHATRPESSCCRCAHHNFQRRAWAVQCREAAPASHERYTKVERSHKTFSIFHGERRIAALRFPTVPDPPTQEATRKCWDPTGGYTMTGRHASTPGTARSRGISASPSAHDPRLSI